MACLFVAAPTPQFKKTSFRPEQLREGFHVPHARHANHQHRAASGSFPIEWRGDRNDRTACLWRTTAGSESAGRMHGTLKTEPLLRKPAHLRQARRDGQAVSADPQQGTSASVIKMQNAR
jgi:hypothetical protein